MRVLPILLGLTACEPAGPGPETIELAPPDAPEVEAIRTTSAARDRPLPAAARADAALVGLRASTKRWFLALSGEQRHVVRAACRARRANPCWMMPDPESERGSRFTPAGFERSDELDDFCLQTVGRGRGCMTPLVVAFDDDPVEYAPATSQRFAFRDQPVATDWPTARTPWIALDRDGDGAITSGLELFGDAVAAHGFAALATLDANRDGVIDRHDPAFESLLLWADANGDRASSPDELRPLSEAVSAISLAYTREPRCTHDGNCEGERASATLRDGRRGTVIDIYLAER